MLLKICIYLWDRISKPGLQLAKTNQGLPCRAVGYRLKLTAGQESRWRLCCSHTDAAAVALELQWKVDLQVRGRQLFITCIWLFVYVTGSVWVKMWFSAVKAGPLLLQQLSFFHMKAQRCRLDQLWRLRPFLALIMHIRETAVWINTGIKQWKLAWLIGAVLDGQVWRIFFSHKQTHDQIFSSLCLLSSLTALNFYFLASELPCSLSFPLIFGKYSFPNYI